MRKQSILPEITRASSKGQIVIPSDIRKMVGIREGSSFAVSARKDTIILKKLNTQMTEEDLRTLKLVEEAWKDIEEGRYKIYTKEKFFKELEKW
ncbi:MAG: AbrB/MazE/SpoVT family DNA-binding domain-containing protein [Candidatus Aenigmarchaeota archaeon]|nr:AbrB/MazE/SpoVT family DNA-binding domain-containing protein [Candidatus Aenigmarchaeota archaeon]